MPPRILHIMDTTKTSFTQKIIEIRNRHGFNGAEFARASSITEPTLHNLEKGHRVNLKNLRRFYRPFCKDEAEFREVLFLAALQLDSESQHQHKAEIKKIAANSIQEEEAIYQSLTEQIKSCLEKLDPESRTNLIKFIQLVPRSRPIQQMIQAFIS